MSDSSKQVVARQLMHEGCTCVAADRSVAHAARMMGELGVGSLPICGHDDRLVGMLTDRDIVIRCVATGLDPSTTIAGDLATGQLIWAYDDTPVNDVLASMEEHLVRRIPVISREDKRLVGIISQSDIAQKLSESQTADLVETLSSAPPMMQAH